MNILKFQFKRIIKKQNIINIYNNILGNIEIKRRDNLYKDLLFLESYGVRVKKYDYSKEVELITDDTRLSIITTYNLFFKYKFCNGKDYQKCSGRRLVKEIHYRFANLFINVK